MTAVNPPRNIDSRLMEKASHLSDSSELDRANAEVLNSISQLPNIKLGIKPILLAIAFLLTILCSEISLASSGLNFQPLIDLSPSRIKGSLPKGRVGLFDTYAPERAFNFSHNSQLFALLQLYDEELASIRVWDTRTGELKYRTIISDFDDASGGGYLNLDFTADDKALIVTGMIAGPHFTWEFTKNENALKSCRGHMVGWTKEIKEPYYTSLTSDSEFSLCQLGVEGELVNYKSWMPEEWWGKILKLSIMEKF